MKLSFLLVLCLLSVLGIVWGDGDRAVVAMRLAVSSRLDAALATARQHSHSTVQQDMTDILQKSHRVNVEIPLQIEALKEEARTASSLTPPDLGLAREKQEKFKELEKQLAPLVASLQSDMKKYISAFDIIDDAERTQRELLELAEESIKKELYKEAQEQQLAAEKLRDMLIAFRETPFYFIPAAQLGDHASVRPPSESSDNSKALSCALPKTRLIR